MQAESGCQEASPRLQVADEQGVGGAEAQETRQGPNVRERLVG